MVKFKVLNKHKPDLYSPCQMTEVHIGGHGSHCIPPGEIPYNDVTCLSHKKIASFTLQILNLKFHKSNIKQLLWELL